MKILSTYLCLVALLISFSSKAQVNLDSLWGVWNDKTQADTNRLKAMHRIAKNAYINSNLDSAFYFVQVQYDFALSLSNKKFMAQALNMKGLL